MHVAASAAGLPASRGLFALQRASADFHVSVFQLVGVAGLATALVLQAGPLGGAVALALISVVAALLRVRSFRQALTT